MSYFTHSVIIVWCDQCLVWSMSFYTHSVINVWCDQCLVWWMSGVINVWCGQCPILHTVWSMSGVINVWCGQCPFIHTVWSMSGVVNVWCGECLVWDECSTVCYTWTGLDGWIIEHLKGTIDINGSLILEESFKSCLVLLWHFDMTYTFLVLLYQGIKKNLSLE